MLDDSVEFHRRAKEAGAADVSLTVYPRMWHDWVLYTEGCHQYEDALTEAVDAIAETARFMQKH